MLLLALEAFLGCFTLANSSTERAMALLQWRLTVMTLIPGVWLLFALTYSRGNYFAFLKSWKIILAAFFLVPLATVILFHDAHFLGVKEAIHTALEQEPSLSDCGLVSTAACYSLAHQDYLGEPSIFGGLYMLRFNSQRRARNYRLDQVEESPRRQGRQQQGKRPRLPFFRRVRREFNRVLGRKLDL